MTARERKDKMRNGLYALMGLILLTPLAGCKHEDDGMSEQQQAKASRLDTIAKTSGGDWEKVSTADREYLVKELSSGSENTAKMLLLAKAGKLKGTPGGGPNTSPPGGAPSPQRQGADPIPRQQTDESVQ